MNLDLSKPVKLRLPSDGEEHIFYNVADYDHQLNRCLLSPVNAGITERLFASVEDIQNV